MVFMASRVHTLAPFWSTPLAFLNLLFSFLILAEVILTRIWHMLTHLSMLSRKALNLVPQAMAMAIETWSAERGLLWPFRLKARKLTGPEQRLLKDIQDALAGYSSTTSPSAGSQARNKRPSPSENTAPAPQTKRARQLPPDWGRDDILSKPSLSDRPVAANNKKSTYDHFAPSVKPKIAPVFLSQEQTQILKLVQDGNSVFYTGSAGMWFVTYWSLCWKVLA